MFSAADIKQRMAERDAAKAAELVSHHLGRSTEADHPLKRGVPARDARRLEQGVASGRSSAAVRTASEGFRALPGLPF